MQVTVVPCLRDNYAYLLDNGHEAIVIDPSESAPVERLLGAAGLDLVAILNTHHHWDHIGGNLALLKRYPELRVFGHEGDAQRIPGFTNAAVEGSPLEVAGLEFEVLYLPGHTDGALAYVGQGCAFTGDALFIAGCGRLFEGTAEELFSSLNEKLARLPSDTRVYCGHEYTIKNLEFAAVVEPDNHRIHERLAQARALRAAGETTMPTTLAEELETNPFLRPHRASVREHFGSAIPSDASPVQVFAALREERNRF